MRQRYQRFNASKSGNKKPSDHAVRGLLLLHVRPKGLAKTSCWRELELVLVPVLEPVLEPVLVPVPVLLSFLPFLQEKFR